MAEEQKESSGILNKVKEAASVATEKAATLKENIWDDEKAAIVSEFKDQGVEKVKSIFENINSSTVIFDHSGFTLSSLGVTLGIPPDVSASFALKEKINEEARSKVLEEAKDNKIITLILKCLFKAEDFYEKLKMGNFKLGSVDIILGLTPGISIKFIK